MLSRDSVRRVDFGYFIRPAGETGTGQPQVEPVVGYLVAQPDGWLLCPPTPCHQPSRGYALNHDDGGHRQG
jgi:hypothetical protein